VSDRPAVALKHKADRVAPLGPGGVEVAEFLHDSRGRRTGPPCGRSLQTDPLVPVLMVELPLHGQPAGVQVEVRKRPVPAAPMTEAR
jgi:hypothetical protein